MIAKDNPLDVRKAAYTLLILRDHEPTPARPPTFRANRAVGRSATPATGDRRPVSERQPGARPHGSPPPRQPARTATRPRGRPIAGAEPIQSPAARTWRSIALALVSRCFAKPRSSLLVIATGAWPRLKQAPASAGKAGDLWLNCCNLRESCPVAKAAHTRVLVLALLMTTDLGEGALAPPAMVM
jgi:hypothetical protein